MEQGHVVEVQRTSQIGRFPHQKNSHSFRGLIAAVLPPFPGRHNNQSFLSRFDYGGATSFSGTVDEKCDLRGRLTKKMRFA